MMDEINEKKKERKVFTFIRKIRREKDMRQKIINRQRSIPIYFLPVNLHDGPLVVYVSYLAGGLTR